MGYAQWRDGTDEGLATCSTDRGGLLQALLLIDLVNVPRGRIQATYLIDARVEATLLGGWLVTAEPVTQGSGRQR